MFKALSVATVALASLSGTAKATGCGSTVLEQNWNHYDGNYRLYTKADATADFPKGDERPGSDGVPHKSGIIFIKGQEGRGDRAYVGRGNLKMKHPEGCVGTNECGMLMSVRLPEPLRSATLSYKFKFDKDYHWTRGGKLPGLCDEQCPTGCVAKDDTGGWSGRVHWRSEGALTSYMYLPGGDEACGRDVYWGVQAESDEWMDLKLYYQMNTPGKKDGVQKIWLDGVLVQHTTGLAYDNTGTHGIDRLKFDNFHGGKSDTFRPDKDQYVWIDDLSVQEGECPPPGAERNLPKNERDYYPGLAPPPAAPAPPTPNPRVERADEVAANVGHSSECAAVWGECHGVSAAQRRACCSEDLQCIQKDFTYGQCRPKSMEKPSDWEGHILTYGAPADTDASASDASRSDDTTDSAADSGSADSDSADREDAARDDSTDSTADSGSADSDSATRDDSADSTADTTTDSDDSEEQTEQTASDAGDSAVPETCAATYKKCGGDFGGCCAAADVCMVKDRFYSQCRPAARGVPDGWIGVPGGRSASTSTETTETATTPPPRPPTPAPATPPPATPASPGASASGAVAAEGSCARTYGKCGGEYGGCCKPDNHCVKKDEHYAQCRPKSSSIREDWDGSIIA